MNNQNKLSQVWDLNTSEIVVMCRKKFDFSGVQIVQTRGSKKSCDIAKQAIAATGATDFVVVFDLDALRIKQHQR